MNDSEQKPDDATTTPYSPEPYVHPSSDDPLTPPAAADAATVPVADPTASAAASPAAAEAAPADEPAAPARSRRGWIIGGVAAGGVVALALSFGGGMLVGLNVGDRDGATFTTISDRDSGGPGFGTDGDRPAPPGGQYGDRDGDGYGPGSGTPGDDSSTQDGSTPDA